MCAHRKQAAAWTAKTTTPSSSRWGRSIRSRDFGGIGTTLLIHPDFPTTRTFACSSEASSPCGRMPATSTADAGYDQRLILIFHYFFLEVIMIIRTHWIHLCCWICCLILVYRLSPVKRLILLKYLWISCSASLASNSSITRTLYVAFYTLVWALVVLRCIILYCIFSLYFAGMTLFNPGFYHYSAGWFSASEPREILSVSGTPMVPIKRWLKRPLPHSYRYCVRVASPRRRSPTASTWYEYFSFPSIRAQG